MKKTLIVIGAGIAGLSAGVYAARSGYRTILLEQADAPGGLCTSWRRKGYLFDGSAAGLAGSAPGTPIFRLWQDLGVIDHCPLHDPDNFGSIRLTDGRTITVYTDIAHLRDHLRDNFPRDAERIDEFAAALWSCTRLEIPFRESEGLKGILAEFRGLGGMLRVLPTILTYGRMTLDQFQSRLVDPACREVFGNLVHFGGTEVPLLTVLLPIAYAHRKMTGMPREGWLSFARAIERRIIESGGELRYRVQVKGLVRRDGAVAGVRLADDSVIEADRVISAADGRFTRTVLLGEPMDEVRDRFAPEFISDQPVQVSLGVAEDWSGQRGPLTYLLDGASSVAGKRQTRLTVHNRFYDPGAAPEGKSSLIAFLESDHAFWKGLAGDPAAYAEQKRLCAEFVIGTIAADRPGFAAHVEVVDVATPLTRERYTGNWLGAMQARKPDPGMVRALMQGGPEYRHRRLKGFYQAGQWVEAWGGITTAAQSGRNVIRTMCKDDRIPFG